MKQPEDTRTAELPGLTRRGRRPLGERAMTPAEKQAAYRQRRAEARWTPNGALDELTRVDLVGRLSSMLAACSAGDLDDVDARQGAAYHAEEIIAELVTRYQLDIAHIKRKSKPSRVTK